VQRLNTENGKKLSEKITGTDSSLWWFKEKGDWWVNGNNP